METGGSLLGGAIVEECLGELGAARVDVLVNNAGLSVRAAAADTSMAVHRRLMEVASELPKQGGG